MEVKVLQRGEVGGEERREGLQPTKQISKRTIQIKGATITEKL